MRKASPVQASKQLHMMEFYPAVDVLKKFEMVVLDEEDCQPTYTIQEEDETLERMEAKIYYPSRDDPECVEVHYSDIKCLAPEAFLSSTIMNFYIRYLQRPVSATGKSRSDNHFFSTYFYGKVKEAVLSKRNDKATVFSKLRRWWKGVNIFEKAYILLPINEDYHWSLVIICLPNKKDKAGPIILHLDSLGYHSSPKIFQNVRSFLKEEWEYLNQTGEPLNLPIADKIWRQLPGRIDEKNITVPQQKNDYDCGIFVLYFMERFIEDAPERFRKKDLAMFGRKWFKSEDASCLRGRIWNLLKEEFDKPTSLESSSSSDQD